MTVETLIVLIVVSFVEEEEAGVRSSFTQMHERFASTFTCR